MSFALVNGQELFYKDSGGSGFPIVMMHGFLMDQSLFDPQVAVLAPTYRCIRFDARAFGQTKWDGQPFSLYDTVVDCLGLMDYLDVRQAVIVGMSQGGYAALRLALDHDERVKALVLMSTKAGVENDEEKPHYVRARDAWVAHGPVEELVNSFATMLLGPKDAPSMATHWDTWTPKWRQYSGDAIFHAINNLVDRDDVTGHVHKIMHPALVTHGHADLGMPIEKGEHLSQLLGNCQGFVTVPDAAHAANYTHPEIINAALVDFMAKTTSA